MQGSSGNSGVCVRPRGDAISRTYEGDMGHSFLQKNMPHDEDYDCEPSKGRKLRHSPSAWLSCFHLTRSWPVAERKSGWTSCFCQYLGVPVPHLQQLAGGQHGSRPRLQGDRPPPPLACPCDRHVINTHCDRIHTRKKHTGSTKDAHQTMLDALP